MKPARQFKYPVLLNLFAFAALAIALFMAPSARADWLDALQRQYNLLTPREFACDWGPGHRCKWELSILSPKARDLMQDRRGTLHFGGRRWTGPNVLASHERRIGRTVVSRGFLLAQVAGGEIVLIDSTDQTPPSGFLSRHGPEVAQGADVATTAVGLSHGFAEANPLGFPAVLALESVMLLASRQSLRACYGLSSMEQSGWAAAAWNLGVVAGLGPMAIVPAVIGYVATKPEHSERFWRCAESVVLR